MTKLDDILFVRERLALDHPYSEAFRFIRDKILLGATDKEILDDFRILHNTIPEVYSVSKGNGLTYDVLQRVRSGLDVNSTIPVSDVRDEPREEPYSTKFTPIKKTPVIEKQTSQAPHTSLSQNSKNDVLPAFRIVKQRLSEGWSYDQIIDELENLEASGHKEYRSKQGRPVTKAILSHWAKELGYDVRPGGKAKENLDKWKENNEGYQWFKAQILAGVTPEAIILEFNKRHATNPQAYSTPLGAGMTISTYNRWRKEVVIANDDTNASKPISLTSPSSAGTLVSISSSPFNTTMDGFYRQRGLYRVLEWARLQTWWEPWKKNFKASSTVLVNEYLDGLKSPAYIITSAFNWGLTEEGCNYWAKADNELKKHIKSDVRAILFAIRRQVSPDKSYIISRDLFYQLVGYGRETFDDDLSLEQICAEIGLGITLEREDSYRFNIHLSGIIIDINKQ